MQFKAIFLGACAAALAAAQSTSLSFTKVPVPVTAGQEETLSYTASDLSSPVTILLRKGAASNLQTVATLTTSATGGSYQWTPSTSLADGTDYALQITQGDQTNYYGPFSITGGSAAAPSGYGSSSSSSVPATITGYTSMTSMVSASPIASGNITAPVSVYNLTTALPGTVSAGTGTTMPRNTTMSSPTLSTRTGGSGPTTTGDGAGYQGTNTAAPTTGAASGLQAGSSIALVFGAIAAILFA